MLPILLGDGVCKQLKDFLENENIEVFDFKNLSSATNYQVVIRDIESGDKFKMNIIFKSFEFYTWTKLSDNIQDDLMSHKTYPCINPIKHGNISIQEECMTLDVAV